MRARPDAPIITVQLGGLGEELYHLPTATRRAGTRVMVFEEALAPDRWPTLCGLEGAVFKYGGAMLRRRLCTVCEKRAPKGTLMRVVKPGGKRRGKPRGKYGKMTELQVRAVHIAHWEQRVPINELGRRFWDRFGYASANACASSLSRSFKDLGLQTHDRIEMTVQASTIHGMKRRKGNSAAYKRFRAGQKGEQYDAPCTGTTSRGKPCRVRAMIGKDVCQFHDPDQRERWQNMTAAMRARSPLHDPARLEPAGPLVELLRGYRSGGGQWRNLSRRTGIPDHYLSNLARGNQERVDRGRAQTIRDALVPLEVAA